MNFKRQLKREEVSVNLTPLIDVVFLLLIFFMVTTTFTRDTRLLITLPEAEGEVTRVDDQQVEVMIARAGTYSVNNRVLANSDPAALREAVGLASEGDTARPILITADAQASHQSVVTAMDTLGSMGFNRINIATRQPDDSND